MLRYLFALLMIAVLLVGGWLAYGVVTAKRQMSAAPPRETLELKTQPFKVWTRLDGHLASRKSTPVSSQLSHKSVVTSLMPDGAAVEVGDTLVTFDAEPIEVEVALLEQEVKVARSDEQSLLQAELPREVSDLQRELKNKQREIDDQSEGLKEHEKLRASGILSEREYERQRRLLADFKEEVESLELQRKQMAEVLHPARKLKARSQVEAAEARLARAQTQLADCKILATSNGMVMYQPLHIDGEFRTVREGDTLFRNQKFLVVADMSDLLVHCEVPEANLRALKQGQPAAISPVAFPNLQIAAEVERVGTMAHSLAGKPTWQKFFTVSVKLRETHPRLRSGMSTSVEVMTYQKDSALLVPRHLIRWKDGFATCVRVRPFGGDELIKFQAGAGDHAMVEALTELKVGDVIAAP